MESITFRCNQRISFRFHVSLSPKASPLGTNRKGGTFCSSFLFKWIPWAFNDCALSSWGSLRLGIHYEYWEKRGKSMCDCYGVEDFEINCSVLEF